MTITYPVILNGAERNEESLFRFFAALRMTLYSFVTLNEVKSLF